jgi:hypothetical protein
MISAANFALQSKTSIPANSTEQCVDAPHAGGMSDSRDVVTSGIEPGTRWQSKADGGASRNLAARVLRAENFAEDEERRCLTKYRTHLDLWQRHKAFDRFWMAYGKLVVSAAAKYSRTPQVFDDLVSAVFLGLLDAINGVSTLHEKD